MSVGRTSWSAAGPLAGPLAFCSSWQRSTRASTADQGGRPTAIVREGAGMSPDEFRRYGHQVVDWIAEYLAHPERYPVLPKIQPGELADALPRRGPKQGEPMQTILQDFENQIVPAATHWNHPGFMAYFATSATGPGILGEMLAAGLNANGMVWKSSPALTELEQVTLEWLREWLGLPGPLFGEIFDTASTSTMHAIAAARECAAPDVRTEG